MDQRKKRPIERPYEIWRSPDGAWEWRVLKKYQTPEREAQNPHARWYCAVKSPFTNGESELGDEYVKTVRRGNVCVHREEQHDHDRIAQ